MTRRIQPGQESPEWPNPNPVVIGVDPALTATGIAFSNLREPITIKPPKSVGIGIERLAWFHAKFQSLFMGVALVVVEGYAFGRPPGKRGGPGATFAFKTGELGGIIRLAIAQARCAHTILPPTRLKMIATGKGNANKLAVFAAARDRLGYVGNSDNEADALWLMEAGRQLIHHPNAIALPKTHMRALREAAIHDREGTWPL